MKSVFFSILVFFQLTCLHAQNIKRANTGSVYGSIDKPLYPFYTEISKSSKIKRIDKWIYSHNSEHPHLSYLQKEAPSKKTKYYWLQAGINGSDRYETILNFFIDTKSKEIYYYDPVEDKKIPFNQWESQPDNYK